MYVLFLQSDNAMNGDAKTPNGSANGFLELAFEYLVAKDTLKWITITSDQVQYVCLSVCLWNHHLWPGSITTRQRIYCICLQRTLLCLSWVCVQPSWVIVI